MVGGVLVATDRRTTGAQVEDQGIELKALSRVRELASLGHVNVTSYNRMLLLTGEVPERDASARASSRPLARSRTCARWSTSWPWPATAR